MSNWFIEFMMIIFKNFWSFCAFLIIFCLVLSFIAEMYSLHCEVKKKKYEYKAYEKASDFLKVLSVPLSDVPEVKEEEKEEENKDESVSND